MSLMTEWYVASQWQSGFELYPSPTYSCPLLEGGLTSEQWAWLMGCTTPPPDPPGFARTSRGSVMISKSLSCWSFSCTRLSTAPKSAVLEEMLHNLDFCDVLVLGGDLDPRQECLELNHSELHQRHLDATNSTAGYSIYGKTPPGPSTQCCSLSRRECPGTSGCDHWGSGCFTQS